MHYFKKLTKHILIRMMFYKNIEFHLVKTIRSELINYTKTT